MYFLLFVIPVAYGIHGLVTGTLPVTNMRSLTGVHARNYSWAFILVSVVIFLVAGTLAFVLPLIVNSRTPPLIAFYMVTVGLPLSLAFLLNRARKLARDLMLPKSKRRVKNSK